MTKRERDDIASMEFFTSVEVLEEDRAAMAAFSSRGIRPVETPGIKALRIGKTRREALVAMYRQDIAEQLLWPEELFEDPELPEAFKRHLRKALR